MKKHIKEFVSFTDILVMLLLFLIELLFTLPHLLTWQIWIALIAGAFTYAASEYIVHRFLFHMPAPKNPFFLSLIRRLHYDHHVDPSNVKLLFLPLWFSLPGFTVYAFIVYLITSSSPLTFAFTAGLTAYFLYYEWKHFIAHKPITPKTAFGKHLKKHHLLHHFKNENYWFGVTHTTFDSAFGTFKKKEDVENSSTVKSLESRSKIKQDLRY